MSALSQTLESILFLSQKPVTLRRLIELTEARKAEIEEAINELAQSCEEGNRGVRILSHEGAYQMVTAPQSASVVEKFSREELRGELTRPSLETLTIIAYRGPVSKIELELIRGVNCSLILRNLLMRGLVSEREDSRTMQTLYSVTHDFLRFLGVTSAEELPDYGRLHNHEELRQLLESGQRTLLADAASGQV